MSAKKTEKTETKKKQNKKPSVEKGGKKSTKVESKKLLFVQFYTAVGTETHDNVGLSMKAAGYSDVDSRKHTSKVTGDPEVQEMIRKKYEEIFIPRMDKVKQKVLSLLETAIEADPLDYVDVETYIDDNGDEHEYQKTKLFRDMSPQARQIINGLDFKGAKGVADIDKITKQDAIKIYMQMQKMVDEKTKPESNENEETEIVIEQIKDKVAAKVKVIQHKNKQSKMANDDYMDEPLEATEEL